MRLEAASSRSAATCWPTVSSRSCACPNFRRSCGSHSKGRSFRCRATRPSPCWRGTCRRSASRSGGSCRDKCITSSPRPTATSAGRRFRTGCSTPRISPSALRGRLSAPRWRRARRTTRRSLSPTTCGRRAQDRRGIFLLECRAGIRRPIARSRPRAEQWNAAFGHAHRFAPHRGHRSRTSRQALARWVAGSVRAVDPKRRTAERCQRRDPRPQRPACSLGNTDGKVTCTLRISEFPARAAAGALPRAPRRRHLVPADRERDRGLDLSRFDVGGVENRVDPGTLSAYLFSDRGLYRPGEEIRAARSCGARTGNARSRASPLRLDIADPRGTLSERSVTRSAPPASARFCHATRDTPAAGTYTVSLSIVRNAERADLIGSVEVQVRDFLPDRLRMRRTSPPNPPKAGYRRRTSRRA